MRIYDSEAKEVSSSKITKEDEQFDFNALPEGRYSCSISNENKVVAQAFEKK